MCYPCVTLATSRACDPLSLSAISYPPSIEYSPVYLAGLPHVVQKLANCCKLQHDAHGPRRLLQSALGNSMLAKPYCPDAEQDLS